MHRQKQENNRKIHQNMKAIGFKNFRRFENFPTMELGPINMLVGGNNAGKSTVVKAALLVRNFLQSKVMDVMMPGSNRPIFSFDVPHVHIGLFSDAQYIDASSNTITFIMEEDGWIFEIEISGDKSANNDMTYGFVNKITIKEQSIFDYVSDEELDCFSLSVDYLRGIVSCHLIPASQGVAFGRNARLERNSLREEIVKLESQIKGEKNFSEIIVLKKQLSETESKYRKLIGETIAVSGDIEIPIYEITYYPTETLTICLLRTLQEYASKPLSAILDKSSIQYKQMSEHKLILQKSLVFLKNMEHWIDEVLSMPTEYIYAHIARQEVFFKSSDKNDYMAQTIHDYSKLRIQPGDAEYQFVTKWMHRFNIAEGYRIQSYGGNAYEIRLFNHSSEEEYDWGMGQSLCNKGMGSIQMTILLMQLAVFIKKYKDSSLKPTIMIEEPEQNLHPKLQSLLADLFLHLYNEYHFHFVIETHSEYMIRKTQVLTSQIDFNSEEVEINGVPFRVFYLYSEEEPIPYKELWYEETGAFNDSFGPGFFDEAGNLDMQILLNEQCKG